MEINNKDDILAKLSAGEQVASNGALKLLGRDLIPQANKAALALKKGGTMQAQQFKHGTLNKKGVQPKHALPKKRPKAKPKPHAGMPDEKEMPGDPDQAMEGMEGYASGTLGLPGIQRTGNSYGRVAGYAPPAPMQAPQLPSNGSFTYVPDDETAGWKSATNRPNLTRQGAPSFAGGYAPGYADGTKKPEGVQPQQPPKPAPQPNAQANSAPTLEQAKRNFELQFGKLPGYANGVMDEFGVQPGRQMVPAGQLQGKFNGQMVPAGPVDNGYRPNWTPGSGQVPPQAETPGFADQAKARAQAYQARTAYTPPAEPAPTSGGAASKLGGLARGLGTLGGLYTGYQAAKAILPENPNHPIEDFVNNVGSKVGDYVGGLFGNAPQAATPQGLPQQTQPQPQPQPQPQFQPSITGRTSKGFGNPGVPMTVNPNNNTTYFTNPDGSGTGQITAPNMQQRMTDGKGSFNVTHLADSPPQADPNAQRMAQLQDIALNGGGNISTMGIGQFLKANNQQRAAQALVNPNLEQQKLAQQQGQFEQAQAANQQAAQGQGQLEQQKLDLESQKAVKGASKENLEQAISHAYATGKSGHPEVQKLIDLYQQLYGQSMGLGLPTQAPA